MEQDLSEAKCVLIRLWNNCPDRMVIILRSHYQLAGFLSNCPMIWSAVLPCIIQSTTLFLVEYNLANIISVNCMDAILTRPELRGSNPVSVIRTWCHYLPSKHLVVVAVSRSANASTNESSDIMCKEKNSVSQCLLYCNGHENERFNIFLTQNPRGMYPQFIFFSSVCLRCNWQGVFLTFP